MWWLIQLICEFLFECGRGGVSESGNPGPNNRLARLIAPNMAAARREAAAAMLALR